MSKTYHVSKRGSDTNSGTAWSPFFTISAAAEAARAGDRIIVHEGEYREWVKPRYGGLSNTRRIIYEAAEGEKVVIKGSERIQIWEHVEGTVWKAALANDFFGDFNPYKEPVTGDWLIAPVGRQVHLGEVYLNGKSFFEAESYEAVVAAEIRPDAFDQWANKRLPLNDPAQTGYQWFAELHDYETVIYANFQGADPNKALVEINV